MLYNSGDQTPVLVIRYLPFPVSGPGMERDERGAKMETPASVRPSVSSASLFSWKTEGDVYEVQYIYNTKVKSAHHLLRFLSLNGNWK